jgi:hypothetical protein
MSYLYTHHEAAQRLGIPGQTAEARSNRLVARLIFLRFTEPCTRCLGTGFATGEVWDFRCPQCDTYGVVLVPLTTEVILDAERRIADGGLTPYFKRMVQHRDVGPTVAALTRTWADSRVALDSRKPRDRTPALTRDEVNRLRDEHYASPMFIYNNRCAVAFEQAKEVEAELKGLHWYRDWDRVGPLMDKLQVLKAQVTAATEAYARSPEREDNACPVFASFLYQKAMPHFVRVLAPTGAHKCMAEERLAEIIPNYQPELLRFEGFVAEAPQFQEPLSEEDRRTGCLNRVCRSPD